MLKTLLDVIVVIQMAKTIKHGKGGADVTSVWLSIVQHNPAHQQIPISSRLFSFLKFLRLKPMTVLAEPGECGTVWLKRSGEKKKKKKKEEYIERRLGQLYK